LLEVLFSMFVLAVGLLGLAAMVPVGKHQVTEASHADRSTAIGQAAHKEIKVRDALDPATWRFFNYTGNAFQAYPASGVVTLPFVVDPLAITSNINSGSSDPQFAFFPHGNGNPNFRTAAPMLAKLDRISLTSVSSSTAASNWALADRIFRSFDDRTFELPSDVTLRPQHMVDSSGVPLPTPSQSEGNYSWLFMVSPPQFAGGPSTVSVVVFYKRDLVVATSGTEPASERFVYLDLVNGGLGGSFGGDAQLRTLSAAPSDSGTMATATSSEFAEKVLKVRPNQWILVSGQLTSGSVPVHKWYRVVSTSEMQSTASPWVVDVTLAGPDWNGGVFNDMESGGFTTMFATICDGVVGVFEKTIQLDEPSLWTAH
jgi:hypothetical protein